VDDLEPADCAIVRGVMLPTLSGLTRALPYLAMGEVVAGNVLGNIFSSSARSPEPVANRYSVCSCGRRRPALVSLHPLCYSMRGL
jgi:hypothetical protein